MIHGLRRAPRRSFRVFSCRCRDRRASPGPHGASVDRRHALLTCRRRSRRRAAPSPSSTADEIARLSAGTVAELLRAVPGLTVTESGGAGGQALVNLRGAEAGHTLVLIDGVRVNDPASARDEFDFAMLSVTDIERIEILRGPQSALYGSDAMGGVINIITRRADRRHQRLAHRRGRQLRHAPHRRSRRAAAPGRLSLIASGTYFANDGFSRVGDRDHGEPDGTEKYAGTRARRASTAAAACASISASTGITRRPTSTSPRRWTPPATRRPATSCRASGGCRFRRRRTASSPTR